MNVKLTGRKPTHAQRFVWSFIFISLVFCVSFRFYTNSSSYMQKKKEKKKLFISFLHLHTEILMVGNTVHNAKVAALLYKVFLQRMYQDLSVTHCVNYWYSKCTNFNHCSSE